MLGLGVEQPPPGTADAIGRERLLQLLALQEHRQPGERAFGRRRRGKRAERGPQMLPGGGIDRDAFTAKDGSEPFRSPGTLTRLVDPRARLQGHAPTTFLVIQRAAELLPRTDEPTSELQSQIR